MGTIEQTIGQEMRRLREAAGIGQSAIAAAARAYGYRWTRAYIAAIERGSKQLSLGELAMLPLLLYDAQVTPTVVNLHQLIPDDGTDTRLVSVGPGLELPIRFARDMLLGDRPTTRPAGRALVATGTLTDAPAPQELPLIRNVDPRAVEAAGDAEQKAAGVLGVTPELLVDVAHRLWGRSLTAERERLVKLRADALLKADPIDGPRRVQAIRGYATRELIEELRSALKTPPTRTRTRRAPRRR
jgi:transcriptional regulator with XRE-family HTH domain